MHRKDSWPFKDQGSKTVRERNIRSKLTGAVTEKRILNSLVSGLEDPCNPDVLMSALDHVGWAIFAVFLMHRFIL